MNNHSILPDAAELKLSTADQLAAEAAEWSDGTRTLAGWVDAPDAVPRSAESVAISIRLPKPMISILKGFANRQGIGYQVLMKRWLDERIRQEAESLLAGRVQKTS
jgi:hypothetical protein